MSSSNMASRFESFSPRAIWSWDICHLHPAAKKKPVASKEMKSFIWNHLFGIQHAKFNQLNLGCSMHI